MSYRRQLRMGARIEREHRATVNYLSRYVRKRGKLPPRGAIYRRIAANHLGEHGTYYSKLKKAGL